MFKKLNERRNRGQSTLEYAILIIIIAAALLSIQAYIKRGLQGRLKSATDDIGGQYSVGNTRVNKISTKVTKTEETFNLGVSKTNINSENSKVNEETEIISANKEYWGK
ncbi:MAG: hypothetical protein HQL25_03560 [Candidatus Omnitrophica bacterium]|nr:hypothetical protein [Candidatus Omnitrophota bacterium]